MKKMYSAPLMEIEKFDVLDAILATSADLGTATYNELTNHSGTNKSSADASYEVIIQSQW